MNIEQFRASRCSYTRAQLLKDRDPQIDAIIDEIEAGSVPVETDLRNVVQLHSYSSGSKDFRYHIVEQTNGKFWWFDWGVDVETLEEAERLLHNEFLND